MGCFPLPKPCTVSLGVNKATEIEIGNGTSHSKQNHVKLLKKHMRNWYQNIQQISFLFSHSQHS